MSATHTAPASAQDPIVRHAIAWAVRLGSGEAGEDEYRAFEAWRRADPRHDAAAARLEQALGVFSRVPDDAGLRRGAQRALLVRPERRRMLRGALGLALLAGGSGLIAQRHYPAAYLVADHATGTAQRRKVALPDGSALWLNARSAVDVAFGPDRRELRLRSGELIVDVARDPARAFIVHSAHGSVRALGTRFLVRLAGDHTLAAVLHSSVRVDSLGGTSTVLAEGHSARFDRHGIRPDTLPPSAASAWEDGFIEVHDRPLEEVVAALRPYRAGILRLSPQAARLRVTGSFPLDDSERTLAALAEALPIAIHRHTDYWVRIELA